MRTFFNQLMHAKMHASDLVQLSCLLAIHPPELKSISQESLETHLAIYWSTSRDRIDRWHFYLSDGAKSWERLEKKRRHKTGVASSDSCAAAIQSLVIPLIAEMIASEPLARVWAAILSVSGQFGSHRDNQYGNVAEHIVSIHRTIREETLAKISTIVTDPDEQEHLLHLAHCTLRWTDLLIAHIEQTGPSSRFAPTPQRCLEFAEDLRRQLASHQQTTAALTIASARKALCEKLPRHTFSDQLNFKIGAAVLQIYSSRDLDPLGLLDPLWTIRLLTTLSRCEGLLEESLDDQSKSVLLS